MNVNSDGLPIIDTLDDFSSLADVDSYYINCIVNRKVIPYYNFSIPKKLGGVRIITSPKTVLKKIQNFIKNKILDTNFVSKKEYKHVYSYKKSCSIVDNARRHIDAKWMIKTDIKEFFNSINEYKVYKFFLELEYSPFIAFCITRLVTCPTPNCKTSCFNNNIIGSLPQGAPTSPKLSNLIFYDTDRNINILSKKYGYIYTRYSDDLTFSTCNDITVYQARCLIASVKHILAMNKYEINEKKTKIIYPHSKKIVTGIIINDRKLFLSKKFKDEIKKDIFFSEKNGLNIQKCFINFNGSSSYFINYLFGKLNFANQVEPKFANFWRNRLIKLINKTDDNKIKELYQAINSLLDAVQLSNANLPFPAVTDNVYINRLKQIISELTRQTEEYLFTEGGILCYMDDNLKRKFQIITDKQIVAEQTNILLNYVKKTK